MATASCTTRTDRAGVSLFFFFLLNMVASHCHALVGDCELLSEVPDLLAALSDMQRGSVAAICFFSHHV